MAYLSKEEILGADDIERDEVDCPEWGGPVLVRGLYAQEYIDMGFDMRDVESGKLNPDELRKMTLKVLVRGTIDEEGERLFTDKDAAVLSRKSFAPVNRVSTRILELSGLKADEEKN